MMKTREFARSLKVPIAIDLLGSKNKESVASRRHRFKQYGCTRSSTCHDESLKENMVISANKASGAQS